MTYDFLDRKFAPLLINLPPVSEVPMFVLRMYGSNGWRAAQMKLGGEHMWRLWQTDRKTEGMDGGQQVQYNT